MEVEALLARQRAYFATGVTRGEAFRRERLRDLLDLIERHEDEFLESLRLDLGKPRIEAYASEIGYLAGEVRHALRHLGRWMRPVRGRLPAMVWPAAGWWQPEPRGVAVVIGPWNYPVQLLLGPAVAALAAGNTAVLKPSELAPCTSALLARLVGEAFDPDYLAVVEGGREVVEDLLFEGCDFVFFTGGGAGGRAVLAAAARHLTPAVLELGGKSPCIVCADAPLETSARRIAWGKFLNAGQTCVAPDHVLVDRRVADAFVDALVAAVRGFYGEDPQVSPDFGRIVNEAHFNRLMALLEHGRVVHGGRHDAAERFIEPTIVRDVRQDSPLMRDEIFGPILPVIEFDGLDEVIERLRGEATPLALYLFTGDQSIERRVLDGTRSGGVCINDTLSQILPRDLPFGGLGPSGMGAYHGRVGFDAFSHRRSVLRRSFRPDPPFRYPPAKASLAVLRRLMRWFG